MKQDINIRFTFSQHVQSKLQNIPTAHTEHILHSETVIKQELLTVHVMKKKITQDAVNATRA